MSLSNLNKDVLNNLFNMIQLNEEKYEVNEIKNDYSTYGKLDLLNKQMMFLKLEALNIIEQYKVNKNINNVKCKCKKVVNTFYYHYLINNEEILSLISNEEWSTYDEFLGKYYYDYDYSFKKVE
jgi:hypothetical protein